MLVMASSWPVFAVATLVKRLGALCVQLGEDAPAVEAKRKQLHAAALSSNARRAKQFYKVTVKVDASRTSMAICFTHCAGASPHCISDERVAPAEGDSPFTQDNGAGMRHDDIPDMLGRVLSGTKFGVRQTRGKFGLGAKMALIWSKVSRPAVASILAFSHHVPAAILLIMAAVGNCQKCHIHALSTPLPAHRR